MLFPRFTIRTALAIVTGCAVVFLIMGMAYRGEKWAWGVTIGVISLLVTALVHGAWFSIVWLFAQVLPVRSSESASMLPRLSSGMPAGSRIDSEAHREQEARGEVSR